jgi:4'-phosphopantetheinyl transferase
VIIRFPELEVTVTTAPLDFDYTHLCPSCGSTAHGRPLVQNGFISLSHSGDLTAVARSDAAPVGIDIESIARITAHPVADALLHPSEAAEFASLDPAARPRHLAELWTAKEAILKATGLGLTVDLRELALEEGELATWPPGIGITTAPRIHKFVVDADIVGAVVVLGG